MADPRVNRALSDMSVRGDAKGAHDVLASARLEQPPGYADAAPTVNGRQPVWIAVVAVGAIIAVGVGLTTRASSPPTQSVESTASGGVVVGNDGLRLLPTVVPPGLALSSVATGTSGKLSPMTVSGILQGGTISASVTALRADGGPQEWLAPRPRNTGTPGGRVESAVQNDPMQLGLSVVAVDDPVMSRILVIGRGVDSQQLATIAAGVHEQAGVLLFDPMTLPSGFQSLYSGTSEMYNLVLGPAEEVLEYTPGSPVDDGRRLNLKASRLQRFDPNAIAWLFPSALTGSGPDGPSLSATFGRKQIHLAAKQGISVAVTSFGAGSAQSVFESTEVVSPDRWASATEYVTPRPSAVASPAS